tara:strand:+ start:172 stop:414 length:243 start_codon:yes stop_codon:yes gene_type:complete
MATIFSFTPDQYEKFVSSKYIGEMYKDKMVWTVVRTTKAAVTIQVGVGIDLDFFNDIYRPFIEELMEDALRPDVLTTTIH